MFEALLLEECGALVLRGVEEGEVLEPHPTIATSTSKVCVRRMPRRAPPR